MPQSCSDYGQGWVGTYPNCTYSASALNTGAPASGTFTGTTGSLGFGEELAGSTFAQDWEKFFDPYDPAEEQRATRSAGIDVGQLGAAWDLQSQQLGTAWDLQSQQLGEGYQQQLGGLFEQAGTGMMGLMESWAGAGQTMSGRKGRQRKALGRDTARQAGGYGLSLGQARATGALGLSQALDTGALGLQQATTDIYQGLEADVYGARESWEQQQRSNLNTLLGMDIWEGEDTDVYSSNESPCPDGYYMPTIESGLSGCQPEGGGIGTGTPPDPIYEQDTEEQCISKGGSWEGGVCNYASGEGGGQGCDPPSGGCPQLTTWNANMCQCIGV